MLTYCLCWIMPICIKIGIGGFTTVHCIFDMWFFACTFAYACTTLVLPRQPLHKIQPLPSASNRDFEEEDEECVACQTSCMIVVLCQYTMFWYKEF